MAQSIIINGVTYTGVPEINVPKSGGGNARFMDTSDANGVATDILSGKTAYVNGTKITGSIQSQGAQTFTPGTSDQTIQAGKYLSGDQTIEGDPNLSPAFIKNGVSIFGVTGTLTSVAVSQDSTTHIVSIS